jgi:hypothetical protein
MVNMRYFYGTVSSWFQQDRLDSLPWKTANVLSVTHARSATLLVLLPNIFLSLVSLTTLHQ